MLHLSKNEEKDDDLPYPNTNYQKHEEHAFPTATDDAESSTSYQPPPDAIMGPAVYPPARHNPQPAYKPDYSLVILKEKAILFTEDMLAIKSRKLYFHSTMKKLFAKLPPSLSKKIEESFKARHPGLSAGVLAAIKFTHTFVSEMCKDAALAKELRDLSLLFCHINSSHSKGSIKMIEEESRSVNALFVERKDTLQKISEDIVSANFDDSSVYSISEGEGDQNISIMIQDTLFEEAAFMTIEEINESDDEQNIEGDYDSHHAFMFHPGPPTKIADMVQSAGLWKPDKELPTQSNSCEHDWKENTVTNYTICNYCGILTIYMSRLNCPKCQLTTCALCAKNYLGKIVNVKRKQQHKPKEEKNFSSNEVRLVKELLKEKTEQVQQMIRDQAKENYEGKFAMQEKEELWQTERSLLVRDLTDALKIIDQLKAEQMRLEEKKDEEIKKLKAQLQEKRDKEIEVQFSKEEFPPLGNFQIARPFMEAEAHYSGNTTTASKIRKITNPLYNVKVEFEIPRSKAFLEQFKPVIDRLKHQGYIGEEPLKHWKKNGELCKLDIINPDITIKDRPLKHVTPAMEDSFKKHVDILLEIGAISPSKSRHRTMAMIVNSGTPTDPVTGREIKGKEKMVFNYKSLNDNTYKDQYSLPGINTIIKRVGGAKVFSKFDLKSRFHQVAMDEESIPWTAFLVPGGLYEWLVMPFGLKNAPAGAVIGEGTIKLQPHIIKKIVNFNEEELKTKKGLRSFLGILSYARNHIPNLGILLRPFYEKINAHGDKRLKSSDYERMHGRMRRNSQMEKVQGRSKRMHKRNEGISSSSSSLSEGSSTVPQCLSEEYEDHLRRSHEDFQPLPRIFTKTIFTHEEPGALYSHYQVKANQTPIIMDKSNAWRSVAQDIEVSIAKEAIKAM
uniref:TPA: orf y n=1 Tax=Tanacetum cinerariifolium TaxID=118510 RepID=A0A6L2KX19_TANCI|nr:TPA: orf y [Tanacetum cinerariifolium]